MKKTAPRQTPQLQFYSRRIVFIHLGLVAIFAISTAVYDAFNLITPNVVADRWALTAVVLACTLIIWQIIRSNIQSQPLHRFLIWIFIVIDILTAGVYVYEQRGMASRAVALFFIPIILAAILRTRRALVITAGLCAAVYSYAAIKYFYDNPSEGYKIELYGDVVFYSAIFFLASLTLSILITSKTTKTPS